MSTVSTATPAATATWQIDPSHSHVGFAVRHLMISTVKGRFQDVEGTVRGDLGDPSGVSIDATIQAASIDTREAQRDAHLRSADFLDVERFPVIRFRGTGVASGADGTLRLAGDLTIRGVTREVTLEVTAEGQGRDPWGGERAGFTAATRINRKDFGLTWNQALETGGVLVGDEVKITIDLEVIRQA